MSGNNIPTIISPPNPVFLDKTVAGLQNRVALSAYDTGNWFANGTVFGLAERDAESGAPKLFWGSDRGKIEYWSLEPDDRLQSFAFFYESGARQQTQRRNYVADLSLIVWYNQKRFDNVQYRLQEAFINEVVDRLTQNNQNVIQGSVQIWTRQSDVFTDFTLTEQTRGWLCAPFNGFRIRFQHRTVQECDYVYQVGNGVNC